MAIKVRGEAGLVRSLMLARGPWPGSTLPPPAALPFVLLLERVTTAPPLGAGPLSVTVPVEELPPVTLVGLRLSDESVGALPTTVNALGLVAVPWGVVTLSGPVVAPAGTPA